MSSAEVIDALFDRTVDIAQSLPKSGPIQTSYEEKLALYSLYKQATEGDVKTRRPGMLDMLGRAKFDAWSNRRGMSGQEAKQLYVESMLKTMRKFSDRPEAMALIEELESFSGDVAQRVMSGECVKACTVCV
jgi:acyl-CoA-binding protein